MFLAFEMNAFFLVETSILCFCQVIFQSRATVAAKLLKNAFVSWQLRRVISRVVDKKAT